jgi:DNA-binding NarL/FixJ family response regulator
VGNSTRIVGTRLAVVISIGTAKKHVNNILGKLNVHSRT